MNPTDAADHADTAQGPAMEIDQCPTPSTESLAWLQKIYDHGKSTNNESLFSYFRGQTKKDDMTLPVINLVTSSCKAVFGSTSTSTSSGTAAAGQLDPSACASYLYYMVAEGLLQQLFPRDAQQTAAARPQRFKGMIKVSNPPACTQLVGSQEFHMPHIECALHLVHFITTTPQATMQQLHVSQLLQRQDMAALLWQAAENFLEVFGPSSTFPLPPQLQQHLRHLQEVLLQEAVFRTGSVTFEVMKAGGGCQFQPGDLSLAHNMIAAYAAQAMQHAQLVAWQLHQAQGSSTGLGASFHEQCAWLMDKVLLNHLHLSFGTHLAVMVSCVVYVTAKIIQAPLSFSTITQVATTKLGWTAETLSHTELSAQPLSHGDLRAFYNTRFLPAVQGGVRAYLQEYGDQATEQQAAMPTANAAPMTQAPSLPPNNTNGMLGASLPPASKDPVARVRFSAIMPHQVVPGAASKPAPWTGSAPPHGSADDKENAVDSSVVAGVPGFVEGSNKAGLLGLPLSGAQQCCNLKGGSVHSSMSLMVMR